MADPQAERWLVVSYWANCEGMTPSFHVDDRLPLLQKAGLELEVLTGVCGPRPAGWGRRWHRVPDLSPSGIRFEIRHVARRWPKPWGTLVKALVTVAVLPLYALEKLLFRFESSFWWWLPAGIVGTYWAKRRRPDLIYSSGGAISGHLTAAFIARRTRVPWVAEVRDPLPYQGFGRGWLFDRVLLWTERLIHRRATGVIYLTRTACERARERAGGRCTTIYAGGELLADPPAHRDPGRLRLAHIGSIAGDRSLRELLSAMAAFAARRPEVVERLQLVLVGSLDPATQRLVHEFPHPEMVEEVGKVARRDAHAKLLEAETALLIQNQNQRAQEAIIPCKVYEYLISGRPVLALTYRSPEVTGLLQEAGHTVVEADDVPGIEAKLEELYDRWERGELTAAPCTRYTRERAAAEMIAWSREIRPAAPEELHV